MTPFSVKLRSLRESRGVLQKSLSISLGVGPTYLSALEKGRKQPPRNAEFFEKLRQCLQLSNDELQELQNTAIATEKLGPLAVGTSSLQLEVALHFAVCLRRIPPGQLRVITAILETIEPQPKRFQFGTSGIDQDKEHSMNNH